jgi:zinc D-Ala-D-Ala carboxypeptidase
MRITSGARSARHHRIISFAMAVAAAAVSAAALPGPVAAVPADATPRTAAVSAAVSAAAEPLPACTRADDPAPYRTYASWASTFLDTRFRVTRYYVPPGLVSTANAGANGGYRVRRLVIADLRALVSGARRAGVTIRVTSAYRSYSAQAALYRYYVALLGPAAAALRVARPGHSEHQLGTALDIADRPGAYAWLARNGYRYGFVVSYPPGARSLSCYQSEPWHIRYFGRSRATLIHYSGLVPRAWLWMHVVSVAP